MTERTSSVAEPLRSATFEPGTGARTQPAPIPLVDLKAQYASIRAEVDAAMQGVLDSTAFILGEEVQRFEAAFAAFCCTEHCVGVSSGTAALELALRALGVGAGDEVITVAHTFIATAEAISAVGARPVFADIDPGTCCLAPEAFERAITERTRAVIPVHLYGQPAAMQEINAIAARHGIAVVEDAAQAHGAELEGSGRAGSWGKIAAFSFYPGKNLGAYGDAGAVTTHDAALAEKVRLLRNHGRRAKYLHDEIGFGERLDTLQAAVLLEKLAHLPEWTRARRQRAAIYGSRLAGLGLELPAESTGSRSAWHLYVVRSDRRDGLRTWLQANGVETGIHYPVPLHLQPAYAMLGYQSGDLPVTEAVAGSCLSLPLYPELSAEQQDRVIALVQEYCVGAAHGDA